MTVGSTTTLRRFMLKGFLFLSVISLIAMDAVAVNAVVTPSERLQFFSDNKIYYYDDLHEVCILRAGQYSDPTTEVSHGFDLGPLNNAESRQVALIQALVTDYNLTPAQAAGIVGNFMHESGGKNLPPNVNERTNTSPGGEGPPMFSGGYGWAQWTGPRQRTFITFAVNNGFMASQNVSATDAANYAYLRHELSLATFSSTIPELRKQTTPEEAAISFEATFEKAGVPAIAQRTANARAAYEAFIGGAGATTVGQGGECDAGLGSSTVVGDVAFPLKGTKSTVLNSYIFSNGTTNTAEHPYTAYDILANPGTPVVAFMSGDVVRVGTDRCGGGTVGIYNEEANAIVSYLHLDTRNRVPERTRVSVGSPVGVVGTRAHGCTVPHLHIDMASGTSRPGCTRLDCPSQNASRFIDIGKQLYDTYQALPN